MTELQNRSKNSIDVKTADLNVGNRTTKDEERVKINKFPSIKKARLAAKPEKKSHRNRNQGYLIDRKNRIWNETKIFLLPLMPTEQDEKDVFIEKEFRCAFCDQLCDEMNLECKVCSKVFHVVCLFKRGHLNTLKVPLRVEWTCSDCSDLSRCLSEEEIRKIINIYDELDFKKNCFVNFNDYMSIKQKLYEQDGELMTEQRRLVEEQRFNLIDKDNSGTITWSEFVEFEAANLLAKKNKIELSNFLSMKELIVAKKKFLSYDRDSTQMINREDAKTCYLEFIEKLKRKLGPAFSAHLSNCAELFGLNPDSEQKANCSKTIWPEFIRKLTILLLYDRLNSTHFRPKFWKPGMWYSIVKNQQQLDEQDRLVNEEPTSINNDNIFRLPSLVNTPSSSGKTHKQDADERNKFIINEIMSENMQLDNFKPHETKEFGTYEYVIRSRHLNNRATLNDKNHHSQDMNQTSSSNEEDSSNNLDPYADANDTPLNDENVLFDHLADSKKAKKNFKPTFSKKSTHNPNKLNRSLNLTSTNWLNDGANVSDSIPVVSVNGFSSNREKYTNNNGTPLVSNSYDHVSKDIYKNFGKIKQFNDYPQQITSFRSTHGKLPSIPIRRNNKIILNSQTTTTNM